MPGNLRLVALVEGGILQAVFGDRPPPYPVDLYLVDRDDEREDPVTGGPVAIDHDPWSVQALVSLIEKG